MGLTFFSNCALDRPPRAYLVILLILAETQLCFHWAYWNTLDSFLKIVPVSIADSGFWPIVCFGDYVSRALIFGQVADWHLIFISVSRLRGLFLHWDNFLSSIYLKYKIGLFAKSKVIKSKGDHQIGCLSKIIHWNHYQWLSVIHHPFLGLPNWLENVPSTWSIGTQSDPTPGSWPPRGNWCFGQKSGFWQGRAAQTQLHSWRRRYVGLSRNHMESVIPLWWAGLQAIDLFFFKWIQLFAGFSQGRVGYPKGIPKRSLPRGSQNGQMCRDPKPHRCRGRGAARAVPPAIHLHGSSWLDGQKYHVLGWFGYFGLVAWFFWLFMVVVCQILMLLTPSILVVPTKVSGGQP